LIAAAERKLKGLHRVETRIDEQYFVGEHFRTPSDEAERIGCPHGGGWDHITAAPLDAH